MIVNSMLLDNKNYIESETIKKQIVIGHTGTINNSHFQKWKNRLNGTYKKTAQYTISLDGTINNHFDPIYTSNILGNTNLDKKSIVILLENEGWLTLNKDSGKFINWVGDIYNRPDIVFEKKWRGYYHWSPYTQKQILSASWLIKKLCNDFYIPKTIIGHNTKFEGDSLDMGIIYKSNLNRNWLDLSPAWDFENFKKNIEKDDN